MPARSTGVREGGGGHGKSPQSARACFGRGFCGLKKIPGAIVETGGCREGICSAAHCHSSASGEESYLPAQIYLANSLDSVPLQAWLGSCGPCSMPGRFQRPSLTSSLFPAPSPRNNSTQYSCRLYKCVQKLRYFLPAAFLLLIFF